MYLNDLLNLKSKSIVLFFVFLNTTICLYNNYDYLSESELYKSAWQSDFYCFSVASKIINNTPRELYNQEEQYSIQGQLITSSKEFSRRGLMPFVYPPFVAQLLLPLSSLDYLTAYKFYSVTSLFIIISSSIIMLCFLGFSTIQLLFILLCILGFKNVFIDTIIGGQFSVIGFLISIILLISIKLQKWTVFGLCLSILSYKFPLFLVFGILSLYFYNTKIIGGFLIGLLSLYLLSSIQLGYYWPLTYYNYAKNYSYGSLAYGSVPFYPKNGAGLYQQLYLIMSNTFYPRVLVYLLFGILLLYPLIKQRKTLSKYSTEAQVNLMSCCLIISIFLSIQCISYDTAILIPPLVFLYSSMKSEIVKNQFILLASLSSVLMMFPEPKEYYGSLLPYFIVTSLWMIFIYYWRLYKHDSKALTVDKCIS